MITREDIDRHAKALLAFCDYPAVHYKVRFSILGVPYEDPELSVLRPAFLKSDIVEELYQTQDERGGWGNFQSKDYSVKTVIPTSSVGIERCLYIGLTAEDRDILFMAEEYLKELLLDPSHKEVREKNERALPWHRASVCNLLEAITPHSPLCDETWKQWLFIAGRAYEDGEYSYEKDKAAQHEVFLTRENRLVPMQSELLLKRREELPDHLEGAMLRHLGRHAAENGHFWDKTPDRLPDNFVSTQTRRWLKTFNYINQFRGSALYLHRAEKWLMENAREDGLWDWGTQTKDPWGYFGYFSCNRNYRHNRAVDCTIEILNFLKQYYDNNQPLS